MSASWLVPAAAAQAAFAGAVVLDKVVLIRQVTVRNLAMASATINLAVGGILLIAIGLPPASSRDALAMLGCGSLLYLYLLPYFMALRTADVSSVAPLFQLVPPFTLALSWALLGEHVVGGALLGFTVVMVGATLLALTGTQGGASRRAVSLMAGSSVLAASQITLLHGLLGRYTFSQTVPLVACGVGATGVAVALVQRGSTRVPLARIDWAAIALAESLTLIAEGLVAVALESGPAALVAVTTGLEPLLVLAFALMLTWRFPLVLREDTVGAVIVTKVAAGLLVLNGLVLVGRAS